MYDFPIFFLTLFAVGKDSTMIGSFAPKKDPYTMSFPKHGWEEAPKGMLARGTYKAKCQFVDDDKNSHLEFEYTFSIKKDWDSKDDE
jgi:Rho GDP-dissociation inhibitor